MKKLTILAAILGMVLITTSCSKPEEVVVTKYFQAMQLNDSDSMASMAVVPKNLDFKSYKIVNVSEPVVEDFRLPAMVQEMEELRKERQKQLNAVRDMQDEVDELEFEMGETRRRSRKAQLQKQIDEKKQAMEAETDQFRELVARMGKLKNDTEFCKNLVKLSTGIRQSPEIYTGKTVKTDVDTHVVFKDGSEEDYVFELVKYELKVEERILPNRLIILSIMSKADLEKARNAAEAEQAVPAETEEVSEDAPATDDSGEAAPGGQL